MYKNNFAILGLNKGSCKFTGSDFADASSLRKCSAENTRA